MATSTASGFILWFNEISIGDIPLVGGKNASLGEMYVELQSAGIAVPNGFAITAEAYRQFLQAAGLAREIESVLSDLDTSDIENLRQRGYRIRHAIQAATFPQKLEQEICQAYDKLCDQASADVAVRSSATAEDLPDASFAGQQETYLNVRGHGQLLDSCRRCFASLLNARRCVKSAKRWG